MGYAIITVGGKQYRVHEGQRLLVDRMALEDGATFTPTVLLVGGDGETTIAPSDVTVTAKVVGRQRGAKIRIGKYRQRTGYRRHTGFRAALTHIEIESIAGAKRPRAAKAAAREATAEPDVAGDEVPKPRASRPRATKPKAEGEPRSEKPPARSRTAKKKPEES